MDYQKYLNERVNIDPETGCWLWAKTLTEQGYGACLSNCPTKHTESAHRVSYRAFVGTIPQYASISHMCEVSHCINPEHLILLDLMHEPTPIKNNNTTGHIYTPMGRFNSIQDAAAAHEISCPTLYARFKNDDQYYRKR